MGMFIISNVLGSSIQISILPLPVLSTLQASGLVFNSICATLILGEPFTRWSLWGTMLVCSGAVLIAIFGAIPSPAHKLSELLDLLGRRPFVIWMSFQAFFVIALAVATEFVSNLTTLMQDARFRLARGFAYGCISGILSAHSLLVAKSAVELLVRTIIERDNQFNHWQSWALVLALITLALSQLYYLHRGLKLVSTSVLYPLIFCIYNIIAILDGLIYFRQTDMIGPLRACLIGLGTFILLSGVLALSWRLSDEQHTPGVGQSSLAPGLGLVEDTDGEEEEEEHLLQAAALDGDEGEEGRRPTTTQYTNNSYQTFRPTRVAAIASSESVPTQLAPQRQRSMARSVRTVSSRWGPTERAEIWGELEDRDSPEPLSPSFSRRRSTTLPTRDRSSLLGRRGASDFPALDGTGESDGAVEEDSLLANSSPRRGFRRRRKSTGFPGFTARKTRKPSSGIQDLWNMKWWKSWRGQPQSQGSYSPQAGTRSASWGGITGSSDEAGTSEPLFGGDRDLERGVLDPRIERSGSRSGSSTRRQQQLQQHQQQMVGADALV